MDQYDMAKLSHQDGSKLQDRSKLAIPDSEPHLTHTK